MALLEERTYKIALVHKCITALNIIKSLYIKLVKLNS